MIQFVDVAKNYKMREGVKQILHPSNIKFELTHNTALLGVNGAGKSTILRLIAGAELPTQGHIIRSASVSWPIGLGNGFKNSMSAQENIRFIAQIHGMDPDEVSAFCDEFADIGTYYRLPVSLYSSGMRARAAFALSMAIPFQVYLIDEILAVGDHIFQKKCKAVFEERISSARCIMVSHSESTLRTHCQNAFVLRHGQLTYFDTLDAAFAYYHVK